MRLLLAASAVLAAIGDAPTTTYAFGPDSVVRYTLVHPAHTVRGQTGKLQGTLTLKGGKLQTPVTLKVPVASFDSGNSNRDANAAQALSALRFPYATLAVSQFQEASRVKDGGAERVAGTATGTLTLRGVTKPVSIPLTAAIAPGRVTVSGSFTLSLTAYGVPRPALIFVPVEDTVAVSVEGVATALP